MRSRLLSGTLVSVACAASLWGCGGGGGGGSSSTPTGASPAPATVTVAVVGSIGNKAYSPNPVQANIGDTVVFRNSDVSMHHIVMDDGSSDFGDLTPGSTSRGLTLSKGTALTFHCTIHPAMVGTINGAVMPDPPCIDSYGYAC